MGHKTLNGWFDNQQSQCRELWCSGTLRCSWTMAMVQSSADHAPWKSYPDVPQQPTSRTWGLDDFEPSPAGSS